MPLDHALTQFEGAGGSQDYSGTLAALRFDESRPYYQAYQDDQAFYQPIAVAGTVHPSIGRAALESYYQFQPPLTRGQLVPDGYPLHRAGFDLEETFFPRIVALDFRLDGDQQIGWSYPDVGRPWSEALAAAFPNLGRYPRQASMPLSAFLADPGTRPVWQDSKGVIDSWFNSNWGVYVSYAPHILFDRLLTAQQIFSDPTSQWAQSEYHAWLEPSWHESLRDFAEAVVVAIVAAYAVGYAGIDYSAGSGVDAGAGAGGASLTTPPSGEVATQLTTTNLTGGLTTLQPVTAAEGLTSALAGAGGLIGQGAALIGAAKGAGAIGGKGNAPADVAAPAAPKKSLTGWALAGLAAAAAAALAWS